MRYKPLRDSIALVMLLSINGCATNQSKPKIGDYSNDPDKPIRMALAKTAEQINLSLRTLAEVKNAELMMTMGQEEMSQLEWQNRVVPPNMDIPISLNWEGPPSPPLKMIADYTGYSFEVRGARPNPLPPIGIKSTSRPAIDLLRDIGTQIGEVGKVRVMPANRHIYLDYETN